jgi:hypothetical protein
MFRSWWASETRVIRYQFFEAELEQGAMIPNKAPELWNPGYRYGNPRIRELITWASKTINHKSALEELAQSEGYRTDA